MAEQFANNAQSTLGAPCALLDPSITVLSAASFPTSGDFRLLIDNELMLCTAVAGIVFTVTRGIEGTTAAAHSLSAAVISPLTAGSLATLGGGGGAPSGPAGGVLDGTYPNPGLAASVAGDGLAETANVLSVNVDGSSIEISADTLRVKALGITNAMLAGSIADAKLSESYIEAGGGRAFSADQSMGGHKLTSVTDPTGAQDAATKAYVDAHSGGTGNVKADGSVPFAADESMGTFNLTNLADPVNLQDAVTLAILNNNASGLMATSVVLATTGALPGCTYSNGTSGVSATLTGNANGALTVDGRTVSLRDRVLVKDQASQLQNGIYRCTQAGDSTHPFILQRSQDMQYSNEFSRRIIFVILGTANTGSTFNCLTDSPTIGTDPVTFGFFFFKRLDAPDVSPTVNYDTTTTTNTIAAGLSYVTGVV